MYYVDLGESFHMSIYYVLAKFGFDTAENGPSKVWRYGVWTPRPPSGVNRRNKFRSGGESTDQVPDFADGTQR